MTQQDANSPHWFQDLEDYDYPKSDFEDLSNDYKEYLQEVEAHPWEEIDS